MIAAAFPLSLRQPSVKGVGQFWASSLLPCTNLRRVAAWVRLALRQPPATQVLADSHATLRLNQWLLPFGFNVNARYGGQGVV